MMKNEQQQYTHSLRGENMVNLTTLEKITYIMKIYNHNSYVTETVFHYDEDLESYKHEWEDAFSGEIDFDNIYEISYNVQDYNEMITRFFLYAESNFEKMKRIYGGQNIVGLDKTLGGYMRVIYEIATSCSALVFLYKKAEVIRSDYIDFFNEIAFENSIIRNIKEVQIILSSSINMMNQLVTYK